MDRLEQSELFLKRLEKYSDEVYALCKQVKYDSIVNEILLQLSRSSSSPGANYIEAIESVSSKDFYFRIKICRKESRESGYWLRRLMVLKPELAVKCTELESESREFVLIFSKILQSQKSE